MRSPLSEITTITAVLRAEKIAHALIGGWAVITWGYLRASDDFDLLIDLPASRLLLLALLTSKIDMAVLRARCRERRVSERLALIHPVDR